MNYANLVFGSIAYLVQYYINKDMKEDLKETIPPDSVYYTPPVIDTYDYIVGGGGTAGCAIASRLTRDSKHGASVLLLEIGGKPPSQTQVPAFMGYYSTLPEIAFQYMSIRQNRTCKAKKDGSFPVRLGKVLGGTSVLNAMFFNRGNPHDFDNWANLTDDESWSYQNVLPYFKKIETYAGEYSESDQHGYEGPMPVTVQKYAPGLDTWLEAGHELGYPNSDPNGPQTLSMGPIEFSKENGRRVSSYEAYIRRVSPPDLENLKILKYAEVTEVVLGEQNEAVGVVYRRHGVYHFVRAAKEVILSAGAFGTPQLLLKSGIGPTEELKALGITPKVDLPVGRNLKEHPLVPLRILINDTRRVYKMERDITEDAMENFLKNGDGPFSADKTLAAQGFAVSQSAIDDGQSDWPDIQFTLYSQDFPHLNVPTGKHEDNETAIFMLPCLGRPRSSGKVTLDPTNISNPPLIDFNLLSDTHDMRAYIEAINKSLEIFETTMAYQRIGARYSTESAPQCSDHVFRSDDYWSCYIHEYVFGGNHGSGTCRMGYSDDPTSVVDSKLRVRGIRSLRVVDASVMPMITNANIQAAVYMIAEKAASDILKDWEQ